MIIDTPVDIGQKLYSKYGTKFREWEVIGFWISAKHSCNSFHAVRYDKQGKVACTMSYLWSDLGKIIFTSKEEISNNS